MNSTENKILSEQIRAGSTEINFKARAIDDTGLLGFFLQEAYLWEKKGAFTIPEQMYEDMTEIILDNEKKFEKNAFFKFLDAGGNVICKSWARVISTNANERYKQHRRDLRTAKAEKKKEEKAIKQAAKNAEIAKPKINSRSKGIRGEQEVNRILQDVIDQVYGELARLEPEGFTEAPKMQRNTLQSDAGGYDCVGIDFLAIEVKNCEKINLKSWWDQTIQQCKKDQDPILIYKIARKGMRVQMMGAIPIGEVESGLSTPVFTEERRVQTKIDIDLDTFLIWFEAKLKHSLGILK